MQILEINKGLLLRSFKEEDAEEFYELTIQSKSYLRRWLGWLDNITTVEDIVTNIQSKLNEPQENNGLPRNFAIIYKGKIVGTIGFNKIDKMNSIGTMGYWLGEEFEGQGIMSKAFQMIINYGFVDLQLNRIEVHVAEGNHQSRALPIRFDFQEEGTLREAEWLYDHYVDHVLYSLLASEWRETSMNRSDLDGDY